MINRLGRRLIFENGRSFDGIGFGTSAHTVAEVIFNTSMVGYQEILSDPAYCGQMVCMTYPLIGNYGLADDDYESRRPYLSGLIVREYNDSPSNYRYTRTLADLLIEHGIPGIMGVDTRAITRMLRDEGNMRAVMTSLDIGVEEGLARIGQAQQPHDQVRRVTSRKLWYARTPNYRYNVVAVDCGIRLSTIKRLTAEGCNVTVVPCDVTAQEIEALRPDGLFISSGPGDPADLQQVQALVRAMQGKLPIFGLDLGHLVIAAANGATIEKMKCGRHGGNLPVRQLATGKVEITSQNHSHIVSAASLSGTPLSATYEGLLDGTVVGLENPSLHVYTMQYQLDAQPGADSPFSRFIASMETAKQQQEVRHA